jgi:chemotaxis protein MotB
VPPQHLAATGFGEYQPLGVGESQDDYAKDRRIELRLTDR